MSGRSGAGCAYTPSCQYNGYPEENDTTTVGGSCHCIREYAAGQLCELCAPGYSGPSCIQGYCIQPAFQPNYITNRNDVNQYCINCKDGLKDSNGRCLSNQLPAQTCAIPLADISTNCTTCLSGRSGKDCSYTPNCKNGGVVNINDMTSIGGSCICPTNRYNSDCSACLPGYSGVACT